MEECASASASGRAESWRAATMKRKAWALSRDSGQPSEPQDEGGASPRERTEEDKAALVEEPGRIPNKIASWLSECRTPLGASLDEQTTTPTKGVIKNGCSFEDDLSLGAEANHLQPGPAKTEAPCFRELAKDKRSQFHQRGQSMNSTGSGKSSTVSSVSELLDLYEEDPVDVLYNLGFGTEEPHIASRIPSRFFGSSSDARGIDIKVYLEAQLQRMELENPNYALTSRFRQMEVLATVTNAFSSLYSQVSGLPVRTIRSCDLESVEATPLKKSSVLNAAKILKKTITKCNLLAAAVAGAENRSPAHGHAPLDPARGGGDSEHAAEQKQQQRSPKGSPSLATVTEESHPSAPDPSADRGPAETGDRAPGGDDGGQADAEQSEGRGRAATSTPDREPSSQLPNPRVALLLTQTRDSFEMEEVQSNEGESSLGACSPGRAGHEQFTRTASQHSDSSGFAEEPSADGSANHLKVQESSDSCDSENTVTSIAGAASAAGALRTGASGGPQGEEESLSPSGPSRPDDREQGPEDAPQTTPESEMAEAERPGSADELGLVTEPVYTVEPQSAAEPPSPTEPGPTFDSYSSTDTGSTVEASSPTEPGSTVDSSSPPEPGSTVNSSSPTEPGSTVVPSSPPEPSTTVEASSPTEPSSTVNSSSPTDPGSTVERRSPTDPDSTAESRSPVPPDAPDGLVASDKVRVALQRAQLRSPPRSPPVSEEQAKARDLRRGRARFPLRRASSLPAQLLSPACVVSSVRIHLRPGSAKHCSPSSVSYRYTPDEQGREEEEQERERQQEEEEVGSIAEEEEDERPSTLHSGPQKVEEEASGSVPPAPCTCPHLMHSSCSLRSVTPDWPEQPLCEQSRSWSTCSMPNLPLYSAPYGLPYSNPHYNGPQSLHYSGLYSKPHRAHYSSPYSLPYNAHSPYDYHCDSPHPGHAYPSYPYPGAPLGPPPQPGRPPSSTEMQLKRVLHDIRGTVQNLTQCSSLRGENAPVPAASPEGSMLSVYENTFQELRLMRKNLNVFRTQMMDLELSLMSQQDRVYQHLSQEERQEAEQLKQLRSEVRQELQELELQLEDRLLFLDEQLHTGLYRHPMGFPGGLSRASLRSASPVTVSEPVSELLREQFSLKAELGCDSPGPSAGHAGTGQTGPGAPGAPVPERSAPSRTGVYRTSVFCTPAPPPRPAPHRPPLRRAAGWETESLHLQEDRGGTSSPHPLEERGATSSPHPLEERGATSSPHPLEERGATSSPHPLEERGGGGGGGGAESPHPLEERGRQPADNLYLQQLIKEIKESIVDEIRQEIVNELLVAMSPRRLPAVTKKSTL
ncbi:hypothetical protein AAFF_G00351640 [Aldrovandia affinis]|uniref:ITPR-interacting domain-containing protein n=1 Tax=Aldrovandia affinis TaxID=143900 RepID=A0AAD7WNG0_9TELE|nr:hypothetical protein AAFF_G00351640 [Aldrovandia affinis]